jgi:hypothetical protein
MKEKTLKEKLSEFIYVCFHLYSHYIKVYVYIVMWLATEDAVHIGNWFY